MLLQEFQIIQAINTNKPAKNHSYALRSPQILRCAHTILSNIVGIVNLLKSKSSFLFAWGRKIGYCLRQFFRFYAI